MVIKDWRTTPMQGYSREKMNRATGGPLLRWDRARVFRIREDPVESRETESDTTFESIHDD